MKRRNSKARIAVFCFLAHLAGCASDDVYFEPTMDFGSLQAVAVLPFQDLSGNKDAGERVRDTFMGMLLATQAVYVLPAGEVARGIGRVGGIAAKGPTTEQIQKLANVLSVQGIFTGVVREYGVVRSGAASANVVSVSLKLMETSGGVVVWSASSTRGGISVWDRLVGGGGEPMNTVTEKVVNDLLDKLFE